MTGKPPYVIVGDVLALDFLNTLIKLPEGVLDFIEDDECLLSWMLQVDMLDEVNIAMIKTHSTREDLNRIAVQVRELREWFRAIVRHLQERPSADVSHIADRLNAILRTDDTFSVLEAGNSSDSVPIQLRVVRRNTSETVILISIAEMLARFLCDEPLERIKICEGAGCQIMFKDLAGAATRRHCGLPSCVPTGQ